MSTGYVFDRRFMEHEISPGHPESPQRLAAIEKKMMETGLIKKVTPVPFLPEPLVHIRRVHTPQHIASIQRIPVTGVIAEHAVSGVLGAVKAVSEGAVNNAFCAIRPPGHHAHNSGGEEGFCYYNNIAIAAKYAQNVHNFKKILIIDWDYHHGNGTEHAFYEDPTVLFFSTHDWYGYPGTGSPSKKGSGAGYGLTINVPLYRGATNEDIINAWDEHLIPSAETFKPDFIMISAGFDSREDDILGCFNITDKGFAALTTRACNLAKKYCDGRLVSILEGGYNTHGLAEAVAAHVAALIDGA